MQNCIWQLTLSIHFEIQLVVIYMYNKMCIPVNKKNPCHMNRYSKFRYLFFYMPFCIESLILYFIARLITYFLTLYLDDLSEWMCSWLHVRRITLCSSHLCFLTGPELFTSLHYFYLYIFDNNFLFMYVQAYLKLVCQFTIVCRPLIMFSFSFC